MNRLGLIIGIFALCVAGLSANAQVQDIEQNFSVFTAVSAADEFDVTLSQSDRHKVVLTVDKVLAPYVKATVKSRTLYFEYDSKAVPKEIKKLYGGRNGLKATMRALVYMQNLDGVELKDDARLSSLSAFEGGSIQITATNGAVIRNLEVSGVSIKVAVDKKSTSTMKLTADDLEINAAGSAVISVSQTSKNLTVNTKGSSNSVINGDTGSLAVNCEGNSDLKMSGKVETLAVHGQRSSDINLLDVETTEADVVLTGSSTLLESASESLRVDISGGSKLYFDGDPDIEIVKVKSSTLMHYGDPEAK
ncbi:MAG: DUF2807 domain-containing protein [Bacteroidales bacterium]|nr:DUF2807 domain-containing protein [Bacteroidales bacterium]